MPAKTVIEARNVRKAYGRTVAVSDVSFEVFEGEIFGLIGPNGAGKTTTMECVEGIRKVVLYPMLVFSGLFFPLDLLPPIVERIAYLLPLTHAVSLLQGIWTGGSWSSHLVQVGVLVGNLLVCTFVSGKIFRWE